MTAELATRGVAGGLLRRARSARGWSQRDLAAAAQVPPSTVGRIESAARQPTLPMLIRLLDAAGAAPEIRIRPSTESSARSRAARPGARGWGPPAEVPVDLTALRGPLGVVVHLPNSIYASGAGSERGFDLRDELHRIEFYETVLSNGTAEQIAEYLNVNELIRLWARLWLPAKVQAAWADTIPFPGRATW